MSTQFQKVMAPPVTLERYSQQELAPIFSSPTSTKKTAAVSDISPSTQTKKRRSYYFFFPYTVGFVSGLVIAYILTILVGYIVTKTSGSDSPLRTAFYGYLIGCQT